MSRKNNNAANRSLLVWHRRAGLVAAVLVVIVAATGVALNHGARLGLDDRRAESGWLLAWYGLEPERPPVSYRAGESWLSWIDGRLYLDEMLVAEGVGPPKGAWRGHEVIAVAAADELVLLTPGGDLVERISSASLPGAVRAVGEAGGRLVLDTPEGPYAADGALLSWEPAEAEPRWTRPATMPEPLRQKLLEAYRGEGLPWSRVLLDLHSGRIFGPWGPYLMDAAAVLLMVLAGTGIFTWLRLRS